MRPGRYSTGKEEERDTQSFGQQRGIVEGPTPQYARGLLQIGTNGQCRRRKKKKGKEGKKKEAFGFIHFILRKSPSEIIAAIYRR